MAIPKLKRDWVGRQVRTQHVLRNGVTEIPAGTVLRVVGNRSGLKLISAPCAHCGVRVYITRVAESDVVLLDPDEVSPAVTPVDLDAEG